MRRPLRSLWAGLLLACWPASAGAQTVFGYQLGVTQSVGGTFGDDPNQVNAAPANPADPVDPAAPVQPAANDQAGANVSSLQGFQSTTTVTANLTVDRLSNSFNHGLVIGVATSQLFPFSVPDTAQEALRQRLSTFTANANYIARMQAPRYTLSFGAGYNFSVNGRLQAGATGGQQGGAAGAGTLPAANAGAFAFNGVTHAVTALAQLQLERIRWDMTFGLNYAFTKNGIYTLAAGALGAQNQGAGANVIATNQGTFIPIDLHTISPTIGYRTRIGRHGTLSAQANSNLSLAQEIRDDVTVDGIVTTIVAGPPLPPETLINQGVLEYFYNFNDNRQLGANATGTFSLRVPTDALGTALPGVTLSPDTLITQARVFYRDLLPFGDLRVVLGAGVAQARLLQAPLNAGGDPDNFDPIASDLLPIADLQIQRRFDPVDVTLVGSRAVGVGAFGASAVVADTAALNLTYTAAIGEQRIVTNVGVNAARVQGVGKEDFPIDPNDPLAAAFNNQGVGVAAGVVVPILQASGFFFDLSLNYAFNYTDPDPDDVLNRPTLAIHTGIATLRGTWGRGTANGAAGVGGASDRDELDAFSANPGTGAPLVTARLLQQGAPLPPIGGRPGEPPAQRRDSRQAYQQNLRQVDAEQKARDKSDAVTGTGSFQEEERRAQEREKKEQDKKEEERSRSFGEVPFEAVPLPENAPPPN